MTRKRFATSYLFKKEQFTFCDRFKNFRKDLPAEYAGVAFHQGQDDDNNDYHSQPTDEQLLGGQRDASDFHAAQWHIGRVREDLGRLDGKIGRVQLSLAACPHSDCFDQSRGCNVIISDGFLLFDLVVTINAGASVCPTSPVVGTVTVASAQDAEIRAITIFGVAVFAFIDILK